MQEVEHIITKFSQGTTASAADMNSSHVHEWLELLFIINGTSHYMFNKQIFLAEPGTAFIIDPWIPHSVGYSKDDNDLFHIWIYFSSQSTAVANPIKVTTNGDFSLRSPSLPLPEEYVRVLTRRWTFLQQMEKLDQATYESLMLEPLNAILDEIMFQSEWGNAANEGNASNVDAVIENIKKYIETNNALDCTLEKLEKLSGYNRFYLSHRFKKYTGTSIGAFINNVRRKYTKAALARGMRQKEIAAELGFSSPSNFWNWLQRNKN
ncbi:MAG: helix-turn-helix transcriptional regulator [Victivallales bacterium]|nr:helix-turn-helix transcriptional regulator [Victivallales bacterium]